MVDVSLREGNRVASVRVDRNVVAAHDDRNYGNDINIVVLGEVLNVSPRACNRFFDDTIKTVVHLHDEPLEPAFINIAGVIFVVIRCFFEGIEVTTDPFECLTEVTHNCANSIAIDVYDADSGKSRERV